MKVSISGLTHSGKSYHATRIAEEFGLRYVSGSQVLLEVAGVTPNGDHFWTSDEGFQLARERAKDTSIDEKTDQAILHIADIYHDVVFDSWTFPWLYKGNDLYRIYLARNLQARVGVSHNSRQQMPYPEDELKKRIRRKDRETKKLFKDRYGIDIRNTSQFNLVINNSTLSAEQTYARIRSELESNYGAKPINSR